MACLWIEKFNEPPPMEFEKLLALIQDKELLEKINELLVRKKSGIELGMEQKIVSINNFIENSLSHLEETASSFDPKKKPDSRILDEGFVKIIENCAL